MLYSTLLTLMTCTYSQPSSPTFWHGVTVNASGVDVAATKEAVALWNAAAGCPVLRYTEDAVADLMVVGDDGRIALHNLALPDGALRRVGIAHCYTDGRCGLYIHEEILTKHCERVSTIAHEIGHGLELDHSEDPTSLMHSPYPACEDGKPVSGRIDIISARKVNVAYCPR